MPATRTPGTAAAAPPPSVPGAAPPEPSPAPPPPDPLPEPPSVPVPPSAPVPSAPGAAGGRLLLAVVRDEVRDPGQRRDDAHHPEQRDHRDRHGLERGRAQQGAQRDGAVEPLRRAGARGGHVERRPSGAADQPRTAGAHLPGDAGGLVRADVEVRDGQVDRQVGVARRVQAHPHGLVARVGQHHLDAAAAHRARVGRLDREHQVADPVDPQGHLDQGRRGRRSRSTPPRVPRRPRRTGSPPATRRPVA